MRAVIEAFRRLGPVDGSLMIVSRALAAVTGGRVRLLKYWFMAQPVPDAPARAARPGGITVEELFAGDPRLAVLDRPAAELARRYTQASRCFAAWQGDELAGFLWFTERRYDEDEVACTFRLHPGDAAVWDYDVHIVPRFRLGRTFARLWEHAFGAMRERRARWTLSRVSAFNAESLRAHERLGAQRTGWAVFLTIGSVHCALTSRGQLKCRTREHGPYPAIDVRAPARAVPTPEREMQDSERLPVPAGNRAAGSGR